MKARNGIEIEPFELLRIFFQPAIFSGDFG
jgi:hypothetical protein